MPNRVSYLIVWNMIIPVLSSPITVQSEPPWMPEPTGRGSVGILLNCLLTLLLWVWTTIHLDYTPTRTSWQQFRIKLLYVIMAMIAPEAMMAVAAIERLDARELRRDWCQAKSLQTRVIIEPGTKDDTIGMAGAFLVCTGGETICLPDRLPDLPTTLTPEGFRNLFELDDHISIDRKQASNKTKTDALGKTHVCAQGMWMIVQYISRKATGLPVTLLELHVAVHVICALMMYVVWWDKPQDVVEPHSLSHDIEWATMHALVTAGFTIEPAQEEWQSSRTTHTKTDPQNEKHVNCQPSWPTFENTIGKSE